MAGFKCDKARVAEAATSLRERGLSPAEELLAAGRAYVEALERFQASAPDMRAEAGETATRAFATEELNELIYEIQDTVPVAVRTYNSLLRDPDDKRHGADSIGG